jgi:hypothetical protein
MTHKLHLLLAASLLLPLTACSADEDTQPAEEEDVYVPPTHDGNWILVDQIHTTKQNPDLRLERNNYNYQGMHGYYRLFQHLDTHGYPYNTISPSEQHDRLTLEMLKDHKILFINLVSSDRPDFSADEIDAIHQYVREGGALFIIADHTNVYYHAQRINPILIPMGIEVMYHTALDRGPEFGIQGGAWTKIRNFTDHPVNDGVQVISFQTGGPLITEHATATLSPNGWGDFWIEDPNEPGFYGNWTYDEGEPRGPLPVVAAAQFGEGRVAVVGDQNIFGDEWIFMGNNFEQVTNLFEWLAKNEFAAPPLRERLEASFYHVGIDIEHSDWNTGTNACNGFFPFFINFNRTPQIVARGGTSFDGKEDALVFTDPVETFTQAQLDQIAAYLDAGKPVVILTDIVQGRSGARQLISHLLPDLELRVSDATVTMNQLPLAPLDANTATLTTPPEITSPILNIDGLRMAGHTYTAGVRCPQDIESSTPYLRRVTATAGDPFLQATLPDGSTTDLARLFNVGQGQLIVFFQDGFWRNETLGTERQLPTPATADAHQIHYRFLDWLIQQGPGKVIAP